MLRVVISGRERYTNANLNFVFRFMEELMLKKEKLAVMALDHRIQLMVQEMDRLETLSEGTVSHFKLKTAEAETEALHDLAIDAAFYSTYPADRKAITELLQRAFALKGKLSALISD